MTYKKLDISAACDRDGNKRHPASTAFMEIVAKKKLLYQTNMQAESVPFLDRPNVRNPMGRFALARL
jgi:hypothetical protein